MVNLIYDYHQMNPTLSSKDAPVHESYLVKMLNTDPTPI